MNKFKVGDKVKVVNMNIILTGNEDRDLQDIIKERLYKLGTECIVTRTWSDYVREYQLDDENQLFQEQMLELVEPKIECPKFKIGDIVNVDYGHDYYIGKIDTIKYYKKENKYLYFITNCGGRCNEINIKLYNNKYYFNE